MNSAFARRSSGRQPLYDRGKVMTAEMLDAGKSRRYLDVTATAFRSAPIGHAPSKAATSPAHLEERYDLSSRPITGNMQRC